MFDIPTERLIAKETALGTLREMEPPQEHIGLRVVAPWKEVPTDDVILDYATGLSTGLAPARAEDAEAELAQKDLVFGGSARASVVDWAEKTRYSASDVMRYRENLLIQARLGGELAAGMPPLSVGTQAEDFAAKVARDDASRKQRLDNRVEWLIMTALHTAGIVYQDSRIKFAIDFGRPDDQHMQAPAGGTFNLTTSDPIGAIQKMQQFMYDRHGVRITRCIGSKKALDSFLNSDRFIARFAPVVGGSPSSPIDPAYLVDGWGPDIARAAVARATSVNFIEYDAVYRERAVGSQTTTNVRFTDDTVLYFLPDEGDVNRLSDDEIGFARTLSSPHPEGGFTAGFYEWEKEETDPWQTVRGTGVKAFPIFLRMEYTYTMKVLP